MITLHIRPGDVTTQILSRNVPGFDVSGRKAKILFDDGARITLRVPGHKEPGSYDRLTGGQQYDYIRAATHVLRVIETVDIEYGAQLVTAEVIS